MTINWNSGFTCGFLKNQIKSWKSVKDPNVLLITEREYCWFTFGQRREILQHSCDSANDSEREEVNIRGWSEEWKEREGKNKEQRTKNEPTGCFRCWSRTERHVRRWRGSRRWTDPFAGAPWDWAPWCFGDPDSASISSETFLQMNWRFSTCLIKDLSWVESWVLLTLHSSLKNLLDLNNRRQWIQISMSTRFNKTKILYLQFGLGGGLFFLFEENY